MKKETKKKEKSNKHTHFDRTDNRKTENGGQLARMELWFIDTKRAGGKVGSSYC